MPDAAQSTRPATAVGVTINRRYASNPLGARPIRSAEVTTDTRRRGTIRYTRRSQRCVDRASTTLCIRGEGLSHPAERSQAHGSRTSCGRGHSPRGLSVVTRGSPTRRVGHAVGRCHVSVEAAFLGASAVALQGYGPRIFGRLPRRRGHEPATQGVVATEGRAVQSRGRSARPLAARLRLARPGGHRRLRVAATIPPACCGHAAPENVARIQEVVDDRTRQFDGVVSVA